MVRNVGVGSLPGTDIVEALKVVIDEHTDFMYLPELPNRGPGADMIGRAGALLSTVAADLAIETTPTGWKFADAPGMHVRRALSWLNEDLDRLEERIGDAEVQLKVQLTGPVTLAATIALQRGERAIADPGAVRDIALAHREAVIAHVRDVRRRLPGATVTMQIDEPAMTAAVRGMLPRQSGFGKLRSLEASVVADIHTGIATAISEAGATPWLHSCAPDWPLALATKAGYRGISGDFSLLTDADEEALGTAIEHDVTIVAGVIPTTDAELSGQPASEVATITPIRLRFQRLGLQQRLAGVVITPTCGLGNVTWKSALVAIARLKATARLLEEDIDG